MNWIWPAALQALAFAVLFAEVLIPSFGLLGVIALGLGIWSWAVILSDLPVAGIVVFGVADAILVPVAIRHMFRYLGRSPVSHRSDVGTGSGLETTSQALRAHVGQAAVTVTALRPAGKVRVGDDIVEARSAGEFVEAGASVRVTDVRGAELLVERNATE